MNILFWNIEGAKTKLDMIPDSRLNSFDILILVETFAVDDLEIEHFITLNQNATKPPMGRPMGGITIGINKRLKVLPRIIAADHQFLGIHLKPLNYCVYGAYFWPNTELEEIVNPLSELLQQTDCETVICGDFNCRTDRRNPRGEELVEALSSLEFECLNDLDEPTYICTNGKSTIDLVFCSARTLQKTKLEILNYDITKHCPLRISLQCSCKVAEDRKRAIRKCDSAVLRKLIYETSISSTCCEPNYIMHILSSHLNEAQCVPYQRKSKPWFNKQLYLKHQNLRKLRSNVDPDYFYQKRAYKSVLQSSKRQYYKNRELQLVEQAQSDKANFWKILRSRTQKAQACCVPLSTWFDHFCKLFSNPNKHDAVILNHNYDADYFDCLFTEPEVHCLIRTQPSGKATGPDGISYDILKQYANDLIPLLTQLFNACWVTGTIPTQWKLSYLIPVYKGKGPKADPNNYRGIALTSCVMKILTGLIYQRLYWWAEVNELLPETQFGFRRGFSTTDAATNLKLTIEKGIQSIGRYYVCFVDFTKAFDTVDRTKLLQKLCDFGVGGYTLQLINCCISHNLFSVLDSGLLSDPIPTATGVPQGDRLSPLLFILFLADLSPILQNTKCSVFFYADDLAIGSTVIDNVQNAMNQLSQYCDENSLEVNVSKTKIVKFRNGGAFSQADKLFYYDQPIEFVSQFLYLGIIFSTKLSSEMHLEHVRIKARNTTLSLLKKVNLSIISFASALRLLLSVVLPAGNYGTQIFQIDHERMKDHQLSLFGLFWKKWCNISHRWSSSTLIYHLFVDDFLGLQICPPQKRRALALYYCNGLHNLLCRNQDCYSLLYNSSCICKFCLVAIRFNDHLSRCSAENFSGSTLPQRILKICSSKT